MEVEIIKYDNLGRGLGYLNDKIIFVPKSVPGDIVIVTITKDTKTYLEGSIKQIIKPSKMRREAICPYFETCGGCDLMNISHTEELEYKLTKINDILKKNNINYEVKDIIKNAKEIFYRNKITLKIQNKQIGYYLSSTHELLIIEKCYLVSESINNILKDINKFNINNGEIIIRCNYKNELLIIINTLDDIENIDYFIDNYNIAGIIKNDICLYGEDYLIHKIDDYLFKISYDAFFQVNDYICQKLFSLIIKNIKNKEKVLDLYCGVGTLSIVSSNTASSVLGVEINENAIKDANINKILNQKNNIDFIGDDTKNILNKITSDYDTVILDPPRSGVNREVLDKIIKEKINKIIYVSCDPFTLARDLNLLNDNYEIEDFKLMDMFLWSEHVESFCVLKLR